MSCATYGARVATSFEKVATRLGGRILIDIEARRYFGVARLPRRVQHVTRHHRIVAISP
ncbi:MAG TPA: hypothetical protein VNU22_00275 [Candidatus Acidoferrum sp.]|jgi:hypothetical protein|nr:hypothetical protein [Candidatus Acidoferrum sp.]